MNKKSLFAGVLFVFVLFCGGCGVVARLGTPTYHETKVPPEYDLSNITEDDVIVVLVNQPSWIRSDVNLRYYMTEALNNALKNALEPASGQLVDYDELADFRARSRGLTTVQIGKGLEADYVLRFSITDFNIEKTPQSDYYSGYMSGNALLVDVAGGTKLWPEDMTAKVIKAGFELESEDKDAAVDRLVNSAARCTVRYLYPCPMKRFKIADDRTDEQWDLWNSTAD